MFVRFYIGDDHVDYEMDILELGLFIKDASAIHCHAVARALNKEAA